MRLHQFLSSVFPRLLKTKSERNRSRTIVEQKASVEKTSGDIHLRLTDLKYAFDTVDPDYGKHSSARSEVTEKNDRGRRGEGGGGTEDETDWASDQLEENRVGAVVSRSRSMIRTNPWLSSPKSTHNETIEESRTGPLLLPRSLPTTPTSSSIGKTLEYRQALQGRRELGLLLPPVPGHLDDSASEGYASTVFRSPSVNDLGSYEGGLDSALASSVSSGSDFDWGASVAPSHFMLHAASTHGYQSFGLECRVNVEGTNEEDEPRLKTDDPIKDATGNVRHELQSTRKQHHAEGVSTQKDGEEPAIGAKTMSQTKHPGDLKLVNCYDQFEHSTQELGQCYSSANQCERSPSSVDCIIRAEEPVSSTADKDDVAVRGDSEKSKEDDKKTDLQKANGRPDNDNVSLRSLSEISNSLQDKVRRLHDQKAYVDAIFHRARQEDRRRESQFAKFRSQFVAAKRQALLRKLQELQTMLGKQSSRLQVVYDAVLLVQWPKVFNVCEARVTEIGVG